MEVHTKNRERFNPQALAILLVALAPVLTTALDAPTFEGDPRYDKVVVEVQLDQPGVEARQQAMATAREKGLALWLDTQMDHLDTPTRNRFATAFEPYTVGTEIIDERARGLQRDLDVVVYVDREKLRFDLASYLFPRHVTPPSVVVILGEEYAGSSGYSVAQDGFATEMLREFFTEQGFRVITQQQIEAHFSTDDLMASLRGGSKPGGRLGRTLNADIVVLGETRTQQEIQQPVGPPKARANTDILIIKASDGSLLERVNAEAAVTGTDIASASRRATEDAVYKVQQKALVAAALGTIQPASEEFSRLIVRSQNIRNAKSAITRFLKSRPLISSVELLHDGRNELVYDVVCTGKLGPLVRDLEDPTDRNFWFVSVQVVQGNMVFDLAARQ